MISHSNETHRCSVCDFKTARSDSFRRHMKKHEIQESIERGITHPDWSSEQIAESRTEGNDSNEENMITIEPVDE